MFTTNNRLLLAISGGVDSVVLAHLLKTSGFNFTLAHCNFKLRGADSDADEAFCRQLAASMHVPIYVKTFNLKTQTHKSGQSTQMQARNLRYTWFNALLQQTQSDYLLTAHHANDLTETILINLVRGTGIAGLKGIAEKTGNKLRPLLLFTKEEITTYANQHNIPFRLDQSNLEDKYERNFLRLHVVPLLQQLNPSLHQTLAKTAMRVHQETLLLNDILAQKKDEFLETQQHDRLRLDIKKLAATPWAHTVLQHIVGNYGFNADQAGNMLNSKTTNRSGQEFYSSTHVATLNRGTLLIAPKTKQTEKTIVITSLAALKRCRLFKTQTVKKFSVPAPNELLIDSSALIYPLTIRPWQTADKFKPFGMKGYKLLSDFMRQEKLNTFEKATCRLLVNGNNEIVWVIGRRSDDRYKVNPKSAPFLKLSVEG